MKRNRRAGLGTHTGRPQEDLARVPAGPTATDRSCRGACRCGRPRSTPGRQRGPRSSPVQDAGERLGIDGAVHHHAPASPHLNHHAARGRLSRPSPAWCRFGFRFGLRLDDGEHEGRNGLGISALDLQRSAPRHQQRSRDAVPAGRRRHQPRSLQALDHDAELPILRPTTAAAELDDVELLGQVADLMDVNNVRSQPRDTSPARRPHRRHTLQGHGHQVQ